MKKSIFALSLCVALLLSACSNANRSPDKSSLDKPTPEDTLMAQLEGMYATKSGINPVYYLIHGGNVYIAENSAFISEVTKILEDVISSSGIAVWSYKDYQYVLENLDPMDVFTCVSDVRVDATHNSVILFEGSQDEKTITLSDDGLTIQETAAVGVAPANMEKLSEQADFSDKRFEAMLQSAKQNCSASASRFWVTPDQYASQIRNLHPEIKSWQIASESDGVVIYTPNGSTTYSYGSLIIADDGVTLLRGWSTDDSETPFTMMYCPDGSSAGLIVRDRIKTDLQTLLNYVALATKNFPGALSAQEIADLYSKYSTNSSLNKTVNSITYQIYISNGVTTIMVSVEDKVSLAPLVTGTPPTTPQPTTPSCNHEYSAATCTAPKTCKLCGATDGGILEHSYESVVTAPTCTAMGYTTYTCTVCGSCYYANYVSADGHRWQDGICTICGNT